MATTAETTLRRRPVEATDTRAEETKPSTKTTEFYAMVAIIVGILAASWYIGRNGATDYFRADKAWLYIAIVASAYMISRGLAKSGSRRDTDRDDGPR